MWNCEHVIYSKKSNEFHKHFNEQIVCGYPKDAAL